MQFAHKINILFPPLLPPSLSRVPAPAPGVGGGNGSDAAAAALSDAFTDKGSVETSGNFHRLKPLHAVLKICTDGRRATRPGIGQTN